MTADGGFRRVSGGGAAHPARPARLDGDDARAGSPDRLRLGGDRSAGGHRGGARAGACARRASRRSGCGHGCLTTSRRCPSLRLRSCCSTASHRCPGSSSIPTCSPMRRRPHEPRSTSSSARAGSMWRWCASSSAASTSSKAKPATAFEDLEAVSGRRDRRRARAVPTGGARRPGLRLSSVAADVGEGGVRRGCARRLPAGGPTERLHGDRHRARRGRR